MLRLLQKECRVSMLRILHVADVHLDTSFYGRDESMRRKLRSACQQAFKSAVDVAIEREVHAFLIAGDLFDNDRLSFPTERFILDEMWRLRKDKIQVGSAVKKLYHPTR